MRIDRVTLIELETSKSGGFVTDTEKTRLDCWATKKDAKRAEYYTAMTAGVEVEAVFEVSPLDYKTQQRLVHGDDTYRITRSYRTGPDTIELTCTRR